MKHPFFSMALVGALAGALSASATTIFLSSGEERSEVAAAIPTNPDVRTELLALRAQNEELIERIHALEIRPAAAPPPRAPVPADVAPEEVRESDAQVAALDGPLPDAFVANVGEALDQIRAQEDRERQERWRDAQAERLEERLGELAVELQLSKYQVDELRVVLTAQDQKRAELFVGGWENVDRATIREDMTALRESTNDALRTILTPEQMEGYEASQGDRGRFFGGGPGGPPGGGDRGRPRGGR